MTIPNAKLADSVFTNFYLPGKEIAVPVEVGVGYGSDLAKVESVTIEVARSVMIKVEGGVPDHEPFIRFHTFGDFAIQFTLMMKARTYVDQYLIVHELVKRLHERYKKEGIEIPYPVRTIISKNKALT